MSHTAKPKIHEGRNVKRFREMLGIKQEALAYELGDEWNQKKISILEQKESINNEILERVAKVLKVPAEAIRNFDEETAIHNVQNNYDNAVVNAGPGVNYQCTINPLDKIVELYERLLASEQEKIELLKEALEKKG
jgi:transcriptional regulator with XRE-family HTH domain